MSGHEAKLAAALEAADVETISALLGGELGETERRALAKVLADFVPPWAREGAQDLRWREHAPYVDAITLARVGVQTFGELKKDWRDMLRVDAAAVLAIIRARRPSWLASWVTFLLERPGGWLSHAWRIVYVLVRERLVERPDHIGYLLGMIHGVKPPQAAREEESWDDRRARERRELADALRADPVLLEQELWRLFETEGTRDHQLDHDWVHALLQLAADGDLDRQRLLDESLAALARDFAQFKAAWYADLHRALEPTRDEQAARAERYLELCASRIPPTVAFALDVLLALDKDERLDPAGVLAYAPAALSAKAKKNALAALGLLERAARRKPALALDAARALLVALEHPAADVQRRALAAIAELVPQPAADDELLAGLLGAADVVSAALRDRVVALCGSAGAEAAARAEPPPAVAASDIDALRRRAAALSPQQAQLCAVDGALAALSALSAPRASEATRAALPTLCAAAVEPVRSLDELCELHAALLESCDDPIELERLLDGLARFAAEEPADLAQRLAPLRKRARTLLKRQWGQPFSEARSLPSAIDGLALAWAERVVPAPEGDRKPQMMSELGLDGFVIWRCYEVAQRLARREAGPLLATPTQRDGFIDPMRLLERGRALTRAPDGYDAVQALLRLAHERRDEALRAFSAASSEVGRALRYALGAALEGPVSSPPLWVAAARARAPLEPSPELSEHLPRALRGAPDCDVPARNALRFSRRGRWSYVYVGTRPAPPSPRQSSRYVTLALHENSDSLDDSDTAFPGGAIFEGHAIAAAALIWPQQREPYYAEGLRCIGGNVEWHDAFWGYRRYLEPLLDAAEPCGEMAALLVATALGCKEPGERTLALDVATAAIEEGRLDGAALGAAYGQLVPNGLLTLPRLADTLAELARGSEHHAAQVCVALAGALRGDKAERGTHALLELLHELCMRSGAALDEHLDHGGEARAFLERNAQGGSKTAKLARTLLQLAPGAHRAEQARAAAVRALEGRLARAERLFVSTQER